MKRVRDRFAFGSATAARFTEARPAESEQRQQQNQSAHHQDRRCNPKYGSHFRLNRSNGVMLAHRSRLVSQLREVLCACRLNIWSDKTPSQSLLSQCAAQSQLCGGIVRMLSRVLGKQLPNALASSVVASRQRAFASVVASPHAIASRRIANSCCFSLPSAWAAIGCPVVRRWSSVVALKPRFRL